MRKVIAVAVLALAPWIFLGLTLGSLTGDWGVSFLVWPGLILFCACFLGLFMGISRLMDWAFYDRH